LQCAKIDSILLVSATDSKTAEQIGVMSQLDQIAFIHKAD
jgi:hypothetical protein